VDLKQTTISASVAATVGVIATLIARPSAPSAPPLPPEVAHAAATQRAKDPSGPPTRLVSCGDSRKATVTGDDTVGVVTLGSKAHAACTLLFARAWPEPPHCTVEGAAIAMATINEMVVRASSPTFTYRCGEAP
jgi:hypothetical protein